VDSPLLRTLVTGAGSSSQFLGGLVIFLLYLVIGLLSAIGSILVFRRIFQGRWEQIFWALFLVVIAAFYLSFAAYFEASTHAWQTEVIAVAVFLACAVGGLFFRSAIAVGYVMLGSGIYLTVCQRHRLACARQARPLLLAWSVIPSSWVASQSLNVPIQLPREK
jgi:hypothetical protein